MAILLALNEVVTLTPSEIRGASNGNSTARILWRSAGYTYLQSRWIVRSHRRSKANPHLGAFDAQALYAPVDGKDSTFGPNYTAIQGYDRKNLVQNWSQH